jgi:N-hydroxyarylamine O-acetyltransferase
VSAPLGFDLDAYLARIGLGGARAPTFAELHRAHATAIPFENIDPQRGLPVSLALGDLEQKLVAERRGGYCFEQNLLLKGALEALGAEVELVLARALLGSAPGEVRPRSHLLLRVQDGDGVWHADVGFGMGTLLEPIPFGPGAEHEQLGWRFRVVERGPELVLQSAESTRWIDLYTFLPYAVPGIDIEAINWWTSTHPSSRFVAGLLLAPNDEDGKRVSLSDWGELALVERTPSSKHATALEYAQLPRVIAEQFGIEDLRLGSDGRQLLLP